MEDGTRPVFTGGRDLFAALADLSFTRYATPRIVPVIYWLTVALHAMAMLWWIIAGFVAGWGWGLAALVVVPLVTVISLAFMRVVLEYLSSVIYIAETVRAYGRRDGLT